MHEPRLRILMTDPHLCGGGQVTYVTRLAGALARRGHEVTIGCKRGSVLVERAVQAGCAVAHFIYRGGMRPRAWLSDVAAVRNYIRIQQPDIIHVSGSQDHWVSALGNASLGRPVCLVRTRHNTYTVKNNWPNRLLNRAWTDYQVVVCDMVRRTLAEHPAFDASRMCAIHNGLDPETYRPDAAAREEVRGEFGYLPEHFVFGIAARLVHAKGHRFLFEAAAGMLEEAPRMRILVLGQGDLEQRLRAMAAELGLGHVVRFAGFREDMARCTQAFDAAVLPSIDCDTSSFSLKEAMAAGKPVIASDYGGLPEVVDDGVEGFVVRAGSAEALREAMRAMMADPARAARMGAAGKARVLREFSMDVFAGRTLEAYHRALEIHRERGGGGR